MRVLLASNYAHLPAITGGLQTTTHDLCLAIRAMGAEAAVLCGRVAGEPGGPPAAGTSSDDSLGYLVLRADAPEQALPMAAAAWGADAIVVQSGTALAPMLLASLSTGRATAAYLHNVETHQLGGNLAPDPSLLYFANSAFTAERWRALYGIDCAIVPPVVAPEPYVAGHTGEHVLFVNPAPIKGVEMLFALAEACPDLPFLVMESWHLNPAWSAWCRQRAARLGNIEWQGPSRDMRAVFARSRVLLMPSVWEESFGRTALEAQLNGLPVLASDRGHLPALVGEAGFTLAPEAPVALWAQALRFLYDPVTSEPHRQAALQQSFAHVASTPLIVGDMLGRLALHAQQTAQNREQQALRVPNTANGAADVPAMATLREVAPRSPRRADCRFYHACTLDDGEDVSGEWDLRPNTFEYLGETQVTGRSVLEVGPASGYLSFYMETAGAAVTCVEPTMEHLWDLVPHQGFDTPGWRENFVSAIEGVRNSFWYLHQQHQSRVRVFEGDPCALPADFGPFDMGVLASVLLHTRRPFDLLQSVADRVRHTMVITEMHDPSLGDEPLAKLLPHRGVDQIDTWWQFTPQFFTSALGLLGFTQCRVTFHRQLQPAYDRDVPFFTVVAERPAPAAGGSLA
ncbi:glycosyltransferase [Acidovorax radicis]|uniref:glycosyltransferase n=1 Tax=Acidovorax radicis TaxID=758826 RepID=UPI001CF8CAB7|nr:glycosyltransferase [Acidovorax radicis]UCU98568.1 glycosyltransferase [Acidovorax radicis]